jgi:hypothetical protein
MMPAWARDVRNVLTVVGVGASIVLWCSYQWFYMQLGITPEDVGIGLDDLLWQSSGALVLVLLIASSLVLVGAPLALLVGIVTRPARRPQNKFVRMTWRGYKRATRELVLTWWLPTAAALPATLFGADERLVLLWFAVTFAVSLRHRDSVLPLKLDIAGSTAAGCISARRMVLWCCTTSI